MDWTVDPDAPLAPSRQLVEQALDGVASGELAPGDQLPSVRGLAAEALVNHNTVARAYRDLEQLGVTRGANGRGVYVTEDGPRIARGLRLEATWEALRRALEEALRAGHDPRELAGLVTATIERRSA
jgi:GntR family transcriptional regulator